MITDHCAQEDASRRDRASQPPVSSHHIWNPAPTGRVDFHQGQGMGESPRKPGTSQAVVRPLRTEIGHPLPTHLLPSSSSPNLQNPSAPSSAQHFFANLNNQSKTSGTSPEELNQMLKDYQTSVMLGDMENRNSRMPPERPRQSDEHAETAQREARERSFPIAGVGNANYSQPESNTVTQRMLNLLVEDNRKLREELDMAHRKTAKLQQLELHYQRIQRDYEDLARRGEKREGLEQEMRNSLEANLRRYAEENIFLQGRLESLLGRLNALESEKSGDEEGAMQSHKCAQQEKALAQLIPQNKELLACKARQEMELEAQRSTLEEQRAHIRILEKALTTAQETNLRNEIELVEARDWRGEVEDSRRVLGKAREELNQREEFHRRNAARLEKDLTQLRLQRPRAYLRAGSSQGEQTHTTAGSIKTGGEDNRSGSTGSERMRLLEEENSRLRDSVKNLRAEINKFEQSTNQLEVKLLEKEALVTVLRRQLDLTQGSGTPSSLTSDSRSLFPSSRVSDAGTSPVDVTRQRLEVVRRRLLNTSRPSRSLSASSQQASTLDPTSIPIGIHGMDTMSYQSLDHRFRRKPVHSLLIPDHFRTHSLGDQLSASPSISRQLTQDQSGSIFQGQEDGDPIENKGNRDTRPLQNQRTDRFEETD